MNVIKSMFSSKKFIATLAGLLAVVLVRKLGLDEATASEVSMQVVALVGIFVGAQGIADAGKEKAIIQSGKV